MTTIYADIQLVGDEFMVVAKGSSFVDTGFTALLDGKDVTELIEVTSNVDTSVSGKYSVRYSFTNTDGFTSSVIRTVVVLDLANPIEGFYLVDPTSYRDYEGNKVSFGKTFEILIIGQEDGSFFTEDLLGGWYAQRAGYGSAYAMQASFTIADDGTLTLVDSYLPGWGDGADAFVGKYDADSSQLVYQVDYAEVMSFYITMTKEEL